jgi:hypothetical protein
MYNNIILMLFVWRLSKKNPYNLPLKILVFFFGKYLNNPPVFSDDVPLAIKERTSSASFTCVCRLFHIYTSLSDSLSLSQ